MIRRVLAPLRWLITLEIGIWRSLFLWLTRRVSGQGPGVVTFPYSKALAPVIAAFIFVSLIELPVVHLLIPWDSVRLVALVISVWGLLWMVGYLASVKVFPHLLDEHGLRVRYGTTADFAIPWDAVEEVAARRRSVPGRPYVRVEDEALSVAVMNQTRVDVVLRRPVTVRLRDAAEEITALRLYVDDPRAFIAGARERLSASRR
jgi:hypothetical protein